MWESARFKGIFLTSRFFCSQAESTPTHLRVTPAVSLLVIDQMKKGYKSMWLDWQPKPAIEFEDLSKICPVGEYRVVDPQVIPAGIIAPGLLAKTHSVLILCSGTMSGRVYAMMNLNRIDGVEIDQMPYAMAFDGNESIPSGVLVQHGSYLGRTTPLPPDFYPYIAASGIYPLQEMPTNDSGSIYDLKIGSQEEAFRILVTSLENNFPEEG